MSKEWKEIGDVDFHVKGLGYIVDDNTERAQQEAWEVAAKINLGPGSGGVSFTQMKEIFGDCSIFDIYNLPYKEVIKKIEAWEEKKKKQIRVGDVVIREGTEFFCNGDEFLVTKVISDYIWGISRTGMTIAKEKSKEFVKTGKSVDHLQVFPDEEKKA